MTVFSLQSNVYVIFLLVQLVFFLPLVYFYSIAGTTAAAIDQATIDIKNTIIATHTMIDPRWFILRQSIHTSRVVGIKFYVRSYQCTLSVSSLVPFLS